MKKIMLVALSMLLMFNAIFLGVGCKDKEDVNNDTTVQDTTTFRAPLSVDNSQNHIKKIVETDDYLIQNGKTDYKIVIPTNADSQIKMAANELVTLSREAIDILFEVITEEEIVAGESKYISLGDTALARNANLTIDYERLGTDGYQIVTQGKTVYVLADGYGCKHGAYELLNDWFNYEYFYIDCYSLEKNENVKLKNYDVIEIPDIPYRAGGFASMWTDQTTISRFRMRIYPEFFVSIRGAIFHNSFKYLPITEHGIAHPDWYSTSNDQICYTARGNQEEYDAMVAETVRVLKEELSTQLDKNLVTFSIQDNTNSCTCSACNKVAEEYGAKSAQIILFLNDVNKEIREWFNGDGQAYKRDLKLCFFAYFGFVVPPASYNESAGAYAPNKGLRCDDGVCALIAPIGADFTESFDATENEETREALLGWQAVTDNLATWFYDTLYVSMQGKFTFYNTFNGYQNRFQYAYDVGSIWMFNQGNDGTYGGQMAFCNLKCYLSSKYAWNVNEDYQTLLTRFFDTMYQDASVVMRKYFEELQSHFVYNKAKYDEEGDCYSGWDKKQYWPKNSLLRWRGYLEEALVAIEALKTTNKELYQSTYTHIVSERLAVNYLLCLFYDGNLSDEDIAKYKAEFIADTEITKNTVAQKILEQWNAA